MDGWKRLEVWIPDQWDVWLKEIAKVRAMSVSALVRQLIRELILARHHEETAELVP